MTTTFLAVPQDDDKVSIFTMDESRGIGPAVGSGHHEGLHCWP